MATDASYADYIAEQLSDAGPIRIRKMFGEYALYHDTKVVGLICDNQLFVKITTPGQTFIGDCELGTPYPGAKAHLLIDERLEDRPWLSELIALTAKALPRPKAKKTRPKSKTASNKQKMKI